MLVTHDLREARRLADFFVILDQGKVVQSGFPQDVLASGNAAERLIESQLPEDESAVPLALFPGGITGSALAAEKPQTVVVGSKNFGESYLLAEIAAQVLEAKGFPAFNSLASAAR